MTRLLFGVVVGLTLALASPNTATAETTGVVEGQLKNGTAGASAPSGVTVVLHMVAENQQVDRRVTQTQPDGRFVFEGLETSAQVKYLPAVEYAGAMYFARPLSLADQPRQTADITVYEPTRSDEWIAFERANLLIQGIAIERLDVMEMGALANAGDRTYLGPEATADGPSPTLRFSLPAGAFDLAPQTGFLPNDLSAGPGGFTTSAPVTPGRLQLAFSYSLGFQGERHELVKRLEYPTLSFNLYVPDVGLQIEAPQLSPLGPAELGGQRFQVFGGQALPAGTQLRIRLVGLPSTSPSSQGLMLSVLGLGCVLLGGGILLAYRRRRTTANDGPCVPRDDRHELERMRLLVAMARLDERFEQGELSEEVYRRERELGKQRLRALGPERAGAAAGGV